MLRETVMEIKDKMQSVLTFGEPDIIVCDWDFLNAGSEDECYYIRFRFDGRNGIYDISVEESEDGEFSFFIGEDGDSSAITSENLYRYLFNCRL